jgi:hypothetical protein
MLNDFFFRVRALFRRRRADSELDDELRFHLEREIEKLTRAGSRLPEAIRQARFNLGGVESVKEECREARGVELLENLLRDIRYSLRVLRKCSALRGAEQAGGDEAV